MVDLSFLNGLETPKDIFSLIYSISLLIGIIAYIYIKNKQRKNGGTSHTKLCKMEKDIISMEIDIKEIKGILKNKKSKKGDK